MPCASVYQLKFKGKTTWGRPLTHATVTGSVCAPGTTTIDGLCVRVPAPFALDGWFAVCACECDVSIDYSMASYAAFWVSAPARGAVLDDADLVWEATFPHVMGLKGTDAETLGVFTGTIDYGEGRLQEFEFVLAGLGKYGNDRFIGFAGNFAGVMDPSYCYISGFCGQSLAWECTESIAEVAAEEAFYDTMAFGAWAIRYNAAASKAYANLGVLPKMAPWTDLIEILGDEPM
ncbi:MAG: hypothetical protein FWF84_06470 [Kiritimatiellaeota bacterium]|nr:hypothetical protein [Kiritimatiellota bacterium]